MLKGKEVFMRQGNLKLNCVSDCLQSSVLTI